MNHDNDRNQTEAVTRFQVPGDPAHWGIITAVKDAPEYEVTARRLHADGDETVSSACYPDQVTASAYDPTIDMAHQIGEEVLLWESRDRAGKLQNHILAPGTRVRWGKAIDNGEGYGAAWTDSPVCACNVNPCDITGGAVETATTILVGLPQTGLHDPNVREDDIIGYVSESFETEGYFYAVRRCIYGAQLQEKVGAVKLWHSSTISDGWQLADGTNGTEDWRGYYLRIAEASFGTYDDYGDTLGSDTVKSDDHPAHTHNIVAGSRLATGTDFSCTTGGPSITLTHSEEDNRPSSKVLFMIERTSR